MRFAKKVCVITGASSGLGKRIAQDLAAEGATVCAVARREDRLKEVARSLGPGAPHSYVVADVSDRVQVARLTEHVEHTYGRCDALVNNAGRSGSGLFSGADSLDDLEQVMATNFFGAAHCTAALLPALKRSAPSHVVNVASIAGRVSFGNASSYCASKFALVGWSEALFYDLKDFGIHVHLIEPGPVPTEGFPQSGLIEHPILSRGLAGSGDVSRAVLKAMRRSKMQTVVPRYYALLPFLRLIAPPLFRIGARKVGAPNASGK